jgi:hypothetical protein
MVDPNEQLCLVLAVNNLSFRLVDNRYFKRCLGSKTQGRTGISTKHLTSLAGKFHQALSDVVGDCFVHLGFDLWTSSNHNHFLVSTLQWISEDWEIVRAGLSLCPITNQDAHSVVLELKKQFEHYHLKESSIISICTDGAETAAATLGGFCDEAEHVWCLVHQLNLVIGDGFEGRVRARGYTEEDEDETPPNSPEIRSEETPQPRSRRDPFWKKAAEGESISYQRDKSKSYDTLHALCAEIASNNLELEADLLDIIEKDSDIVCNVTSISSAMDAWKLGRKIITKFVVLFFFKKRLQEVEMF